MLISLPNISDAGSVSPTKLPRLLLIFIAPSRPSRIGKTKTTCWLAFVFLKIAADEAVEKLIGSTQFHIGFHHDRIPALHDWVLNLVRVDRMAFVDPIPEIFAL